MRDVPAGHDPGPAPRHLQPDPGGVPATGFRMGDRCHVVRRHRHLHHVIRYRRVRQAQRHSGGPGVRQGAELRPAGRNHVLLLHHLRVHTEADPFCLWASEVS